MNASRWKIVGLFFLFLCISTLVFFPSINGSSNWDDRVHLIDNPYFVNRSLLDLHHFWIKPYFSLYIPLTYTVWGAFVWFNHQIGGSIHQLLMILSFNNIFWHSINGFLCYLIARQTKLSKKLSFLISLGFLIHPINSDSVLWLSEFRGLLSAAFVFLGYYFRKTLVFKKFFHYGIFVLLAAVLSKPSGVILGVIFCLTTYKKVSVKQFITWIKPLVIIVICLIPVVITKFAQHTDTKDFDVNFLDRISIVLKNLVFYVYKNTIPIELSHIYSQQLNSSDLLVSTIIFLIIFILIIISDSSVRKFVFLFIIALLPTIGLLDFSFQEKSVFANRYSYVASFFFIILLIKLLRQGLSDFSVIILFGTLLCMTYIPGTISQIDTWENTEKMWFNESMRNPNRVWVANQHYSFSENTLEVSFLNHVAFPNVEMFKLNFARELMEVNELNAANSIIRNIKSTNSKMDSVLHLINSKILFDQNNYNEALESYLISIGGNLNTRNKCYQYLTLFLFKHGKNKTLKEFSKCNQWGELPPLLELKKNISTMTSDFPKKPTESKIFGMNRGLYEDLLKSYQKKEYKKVHKILTSTLTYNSIYAKEIYKILLFTSWFVNDEESFWFALKMLKVYYSSQSIGVFKELVFRLNSWKEYRQIFYLLIRCYIHEGFNEDYYPEFELLNKRLNLPENFIFWK